MTYRLDMDGETRVLISHMAPLRRKRIKESLRAIAQNPFEGKPLQEDLLGFYSHRVGTMRIVYSVDKPARIVHVVVIGPRQTVYEEIEQVLRRRA